MAFEKDIPLTPEQVEKSEWNRAMNMPMAGEQPPLPWLPQPPKQHPMVDMIDAFSNRRLKQEPIDYGSPERMKKYDSEAPAVERPGGAATSYDPNQTSKPRQQMAPKVKSPVSKSVDTMKSKAKAMDAMADWITTISGEDR